MKFTLIMLVLIFFISSCASQQLGNLTIESTFKDKKMQSFVEAVTDGQLDVADKFLNQGLNINTIGVEGITPLLWVMGIDRDIENIEYMLKNGANPNYVVRGRKVSAMYFAVGGDSEDILRLFLKYQGDPNLVGPDYKSMLMVAIIQQRESYFDLLLAHGANINWHNKHHQSAPWTALTPGRFDWAIYFLEQGYNNNLQHLAAGAESRLVPKYMQPYKEKLIDMLKERGAIFPAGPMVKNYLKTHYVTDEELQDLIYGRKIISRNSEGQKVIVEK